MIGNLIIKKGKVWNSKKECLEIKDVLIEKGIISKINKNIKIYDNFITINAENKLVLPGGIDSHVHFNDPGFTDREDFYHGTMAAAKGGVTTIIDMPCTSIPPVTDLNSLNYKLNIVKNKAIVDYGFFAGVSDNVFKGFEKNMEVLSNIVFGFKTYFISGMASFKSLNKNQFAKVIEKANQLNTVVLIHAEDKNYIEENLDNLNNKINSPYLYYKTRDELAEIKAVKMAIEACGKYSKCLHIVHVGTGEVLNIIKNTNITCETAPHYLQFDCEDFEKIGAPLKVNPPVKLNKNKKMLWDGLKRSEIGFVASDHAPCKLVEKNTGSIFTDYSGIPGCETMIPYVFSEGYKNSRISLKTFVDITSANSAKRFGLAEKGSIEIGKDGDFMIIDENSYTKIIQNKLFSKGKISPFHNFNLKGKVEKTVLRGVEVYNCNNGIKIEKGFGKFLKKNS